MGFSIKTWEDRYYDGEDEYSDVEQKLIDHYNNKGWDNVEEIYHESIHDISDDYELKLMKGEIERKY